MSDAHRTRDAATACRRLRGVRSAVAVRPRHAEHDRWSVELETETDDGIPPSVARVLAWYRLRIRTAVDRDGAIHTVAVARPA